MMDDSIFPYGENPVTPYRGYRERPHDDPALYRGSSPAVEPAPDLIACRYTVRYAHHTDKRAIIRSAQTKQVDYMTTNQLVDDIAMKRLVIVVDNHKNKIVAWCAIDGSAYETRGYFAIKRMMVPNKKYRRQGIADFMLKWILEENPKLTFGATPWVDNAAMRTMLEKNDFTLRYTFGADGMWCCYVRG